MGGKDSVYMDEVGSVVIFPFSDKIGISFTEDLYVFLTPDVAKKFAWDVLEVSEMVEMSKGEDES